MKAFREIIDRLCQKELNLKNAIRDDKSNQVKPENWSLFFDENIFLSDQNYFKPYLNSWFSLIKSNAISSHEFQFLTLFSRKDMLCETILNESSRSSENWDLPTSKDVIVKMIEWMVVSLRRMIILDSFNIEVLQEIADFMHNIASREHLEKECIHWFFIMFWVSVSFIQTIIINKPNTKAKILIDCGLKILSNLIKEEKFKDFLCTTPNLPTSFKYYSIFMDQKIWEKDEKEYGIHAFIKDYLCLYDLLFKYILESGNYFYNLCRNGRTVQWDWNNTRHWY